MGIMIDGKSVENEEQVKERLLVVLYTKWRQGEVFSQVGLPIHELVEESKIDFGGVDPLDLVREMIEDGWIEIVSPRSRRHQGSTSDTVRLKTEGRRKACSLLESPYGRYLKESSGFLITKVTEGLGNFILHQ
jgi:hypothetical protein